MTKLDYEPKPTPRQRLYSATLGAAEVMIGFVLTILIFMLGFLWFFG